MSKATELVAGAAVQAAEHGRHIFIYNNVRTNQVVYSLYRSMHNNSVLSQIAFVGKKSVPATIRKDVWRPLATVTFPTDHQGLSAYRKLREFRKMHELTWAPKDEKVLPEKKKRIRMLMDQKANSVADLAAVLKIQEKKAVELAQKISYEQEVQERIEAKSRQEIEDLAAKANANDGEFIKRVDAHLAKVEQNYQEKFVKQEGDPVQKKNLEMTIKGLRRLKKRLHTAQAIVDPEMRREVRRWKAREEKAKKEAEENGETYTPSPRPPPREPQPRTLPKYGRLRKLMLSAQKPFIPMTTEGVTIRWANIADAEFAEEWPEKVEHGVLGLVRHTAPDVFAAPKEFPKTDEEFMEQQQLDEDVSEEGGEDQPEAPEDVEQRQQKKDERTGKNQQEEQHKAADTPTKDNKPLTSRLRSLFGGKGSDS